jgi:GT2 family glycosyltransferase
MGKTCAEALALPCTANANMWNLWDFARVCYLMTFRNHLMKTSFMAEDLTVLIANLGQLENLRSCLKSIFDPATSGQTSLRVIVGFNFQGQSETPRALAREFPQVEQLRAPAKLGYCRAYNQLLARSTGRYLLLLDDDTVLRSGAIDGMVRFMDAHPEVGIAGCRTTNQDGSYQKTTGLMYSMGTEIINVFRPAAFWKDGVDESVTAWKPVGWLNGHFLLTRAKAIEQVGRLDERFYTYQCEADWCLRIRRAGWKVAYVPDFEVMHIGGANRVATYKNLIRGNVNRYYFIRKHYGAAAYHLFRVIMTAGAMLRLVKYAAMWLVRPERRPVAGPQVAGYWKTALLGAAAHPEELPEDLRRENASAALFQLDIPGETSRRSDYYSDWALENQRKN